MTGEESVAVSRTTVAEAADHLRVYADELEGAGVEGGVLDEVEAAVAELEDALGT